MGTVPYSTVAILGVGGLEHLMRIRILLIAFMLVGTGPSPDPALKPISITFGTMVEN